MTKRLSPAGRRRTRSRSPSPPGRLCTRSTPKTRTETCARPLRGTCRHGRRARQEYGVASDHQETPAASRARSSGVPPSSSAGFSRPSSGRDGHRADRSPEEDRAQDARLASRGRRRAPRRGPSREPSRTPRRSAGRCPRPTRPAASATRPAAVAAELCFATSTGTFACWTTPLETLPSSAPARAPCPREPITIRSAPQLSAKLRISSTALPSSTSPRASMPASRACFSAASTVARATPRSRARRHS